MYCTFWKTLVKLLKHRCLCWAPDVKWNLSNGFALPDSSPDASNWHSVQSMSPWTPPLYSAGVQAFKCHVWPLTHPHFVYSLLMKLYVHMENTQQQSEESVWQPFSSACLSWGDFFLSASIPRTQTALGLSWTCQQVCCDQGIRRSWLLSLKDCWRM